MYALTTALAANLAPTAGSLPGPTCGLPSEVTAMAATFVGWEKGFLVVVAIIAVFACLVMWAIGTGFKLRHVAEAGQTGLVVVFGIVFVAAVVTGLLQVALGYMSC